jgi:hypothetical protein
MTATTLPSAGHREEHYMTPEQRVRAYGALITRGPRGGPFRLAERYGRKRELGTYRTVAALERAIERHNDRMWRKSKRELRQHARD